MNANRSAKDSDNFAFVVYTEFIFVPISQMGEKSPERQGGLSK